MESTVAGIIAREAERQESTIELIASENHVSPAVMEAVGSCLTNKYAEGYPGKRYYGGCQNYDEVERLAQERAQQLFGCAYANVQPHSGASANIAAFFAFMQPGDKYASLVLSDGGHLSHGLKINISGKYFEPVHYPLVYDARPSITTRCAISVSSTSPRWFSVATPPIRASSTLPACVRSPTSAARL